MAGGLPEGLVSNKKGVTKGIEEATRLEAEDTLRLWRSIAILAKFLGQKTADIVT